MRKILKTIILIMAFNSVCAQKNDFGTWTNLEVEFQFNDKWGGFAELQLRSLSPFDRFYYYEIKGGLAYSFQEKYSFTLGTGFFNTFNEGPEYDGYNKKKEFRVWQQFEMEQKLSIVDIEHRYIAEQRFTDKFDNRFRYRLKTEVPINHKEIIDNTLFLTIYNELFFTDIKPLFRRNRFQLGAGYQFNKTLTIETGWINQVDYSANEQQVSKNYFFSSLSFELE